MSTRPEKDGVLRDYAAVIKALLPGADGLVCHDARGRAFWSLPSSSGALPQGEEYARALAAMLKARAPRGEAVVVRLPAALACLLPLESEVGRRLGVLTVLVDPAYDVPAADIGATLAPAARSLQRELSLRFMMLEARGKLEVQAAEELLLHKVESLLHQSQPCKAALQAVVGLCHEHLGIGGAWLVIPERKIAAAAGPAASVTEATLQCPDLLAEARDAAAAPGAVTTRGELLWLPVHTRGSAAQGIFALVGHEKSGFSDRRLRRVARYIGSHIDSLLDREYDSLTGMATWPAFEREVAAAVAGQGADSHVVMSLDVDGLHVVNDAFGRDVGDEVLGRLATLLRELLPGHLVARVSGDKFAALLRDTGSADARRLAETLCQRFREHAFVRGGQTHRASVSIGMAPLDAGSDINAVLAAAQVACRAAKDRGRGRVEVYEPGDASIVRRLDDVQKVGYVRNAIESGRLALVAQRLVALKPGRVSNYFEVLVRIVDDAGQHVSPGEFMSAAERYQLMEELDRWVVSSTLGILAHNGRHLAGATVRFAINLSGQSLGSETFLHFAEQAIRDSGVSPALLAFEITESVAVARMQQAQALMNMLRRLGCHISLDDFGTGLSSFAYLKLFPVDTLKIDGSFVRDIATNVVSQSVVAAIAEVARVMQLETVAEYVQDEAGVELLRSLNISYAQGFFVGSTAPLELQISRLGQESSSGGRLLKPSGA